MRWRTWWRWGREQKVKVISVEDDGPPIESSNVHDDERPWTGVVLREFDLPRHEGGWLGAGIGVHSGPLSLGEDEEVYNRKNPPPAPPTGSVDAAAIAFMRGTLDFHPHPRQIEFYERLVKSSSPGGGGLWGFTSGMGCMDDLKAFAEEQGKDWTSPALQTEYLTARVGAGGGYMHFYFDEVATEIQGIGQDKYPESQYEPLHREFLLTIDHVRDVIGDKKFAEKMREDLLGLWHEDKVAKGLTAPQALGMTEDQYSAWVEKKESSQ